VRVGTSICDSALRASNPIAALGGLGEPRRFARTG
jgi:hypothetical protein